MHELLITLAEYWDQFPRRTEVPVRGLTGWFDAHRRGEDSIRVATNYTLTISGEAPLNIWGIGTERVCALIRGSVGTARMYVWKPADAVDGSQPNELLVIQLGAQELLILKK